MGSTAEKLSRKSRLTLRAIILWLGSGHIGYGVVFADDSMAPEKRTSEGAKELDNLEQCMKSMEIQEKDGPKFELLCSAARWGYADEPRKMASQPPLPGWGRDNVAEIYAVMQELRDKLRDSNCGGAYPLIPLILPPPSPLELVSRQRNNAK